MNGIEDRWRYTERSEEAGDLASMMGGMIDDVEHYLRDCVVAVGAAQVLVREQAVAIVIGE
jgi:hypothetical protein